MRTLLALLLFALVTIVTVQSQTETPFSKTIDWSSQSVDEAREDLQKARTEIAAQQKPQLEELSRIQSDVTALKRERDQLKFSTDSMKDQVEKRMARVQAIASQQQDVQYRLLHIRRKLEENLYSIENPNYRETFLSLEQIKTDTPAARLERLKALFAIAEKAADRIDDQIGGTRYPTKILAKSVMVDGTALQIGPYAFFAPNEGNAGLVVTGEDLITRLRSHMPETAQAIAANLNGQAVSSPFDPLLNQAFLNADAETSFWDHLKSGGIWIIPITIFGLLSSVIALLKLLQIRTIRIPETKLVASLANTADPEEFERQLEGVTPHARPIFAEGFAYRDAPENARSAAMSQAILSFRDRLESRLSLLGLTAAVAPLLGLLGTVTGMIKTFQIISLHGAGDARTLSGGISEALVTTEFGLVVAIPALLAHAWLNRRAKRISIQTTALAERFNQTVSTK